MMETAADKAIRFSVIIPVYNGAATIERAIESCLQQTYAPYEIIVADDASTDGTESILEKYASVIKYVRRVNNGGSAAARNTAMEKATGNYLAFLDADDLWHPEKLMLIGTILESKPGIDLIYHPFTTEPIANVVIPERALLYRLPFVKLLTRNTIGTPCVVISNKKTFRFEDSMRHMEDYDLWLRIGYKHKIYFIEVPLTQIGRPVLAEGGVSADTWKMRKGELKAYSRLTKSHPLFVLLLPGLYVLSLGKHLVKQVIGKR